MKSKSKFRIIWAMYCILILPFVLITIIADLLDRFISVCDSYVEEVKIWIINRYKPDEDE
jgi:hypothetical protein